MYISRYIAIFLVMILLISCNQQSSIQNATGYIIGDAYSQYLDGNIRSFDIINDSLFVASEDYGVVIYRIVKEEHGIYLDFLSSTNVVGIPVTLDIAPKSRSLIILDDYNHTYIGKLDFFGTNSYLSAVDCDDYQRKSTFLDYEDKPIELITPFRHKPTQNEVDSLAWNTSFIHRIKFSELEYSFNDYSGDCSDTLYKYLNYDIEDIFYSNEKLYLANPENDKYSVVILNHDINADSFSPLDTIVLAGKPVSIKGDEELIFIGLNDKKGCYIKLLDSDSLNYSNFSIASGYNIQDIELSNNYIALSAGYGGSLIFDWDNSEDIFPELRFLLGGGIYSYKTMMYDDMNMIVGTKNGLHIYEIER